MKALSILVTAFLFTSVLPAFANQSKSQEWKWDKDNITMSDIRFDPEFLIVSVPIEDSKGSKSQLSVQCGNNPNFYYKQSGLKNKVGTMETDKQLVTQLCSQAFEMRDVYIRQLLATETCKRINWQYGISRIPVALYGDLAKKKDHNGNGFACKL